MLHFGTTLIIFGLLLTHAECFGLRKRPPQQPQQPQTQKPPAGQSSNCPTTTTPKPKICSAKTFIVLTAFTNANWMLHNTTCTKAGGRLAIPESQQEFSQIQSAIDEQNKQFGYDPQHQSDGLDAVKANLQYVFLGVQQIAAVDAEKQTLADNAYWYTLQADQSGQQTKQCACYDSKIRRVNASPGCPCTSGYRGVCSFCNAY